MPSRSIDTADMQLDLTGAAASLGVIAAGVAVGVAVAALTPRTRGAGEAPAGLSSRAVNAVALSPAIYLVGWAFAVYGRTAPLMVLFIAALLGGVAAAARHPAEQLRQALLIMFASCSAVAVIGALAAPESRDLGFVLFIGALLFVPALLLCLGSFGAGSALRHIER